MNAYTISGFRMVDLAKAEKLISEYVKYWEKQGLHSINDIVEDCDFGAEYLQLVRNGFLFEYFSHDELSRLPALLTRELKAQINYDHKYFWAYFVFLTYSLRVKLFYDHDWQSSFANLVNLVLSNTRGVNRTRIKDRESFMRETTIQRMLLARCVNSHLLETKSNKWGISAPLAFSVLEGLLKRKNQDCVNIDGTIKTDFNIINLRTGKKNHYEKEGKKRLNRIGDSLRCFEQVTLPKQNRTCNYLQDFKTEVCSLYLLPLDSDVCELIDNWRNDLIHGKEYWTARVPVLLNLICLLLIDEINPVLYDSERINLQRRIEWERGVHTLNSSRASWEVYPPDL